MDKTRRKILKGAAAGGALLTIGALGGAGGFKAGQTITRTGYELEIAKLRTLLKLYEELDKVGLDALLRTALKVIKLPADAVKTGIGSIREAIEIAEEALKKLLSALERWREFLKEGDEVLLTLISLLEETGKLMVKVVGKILPFAEAVIEFFAGLLKNLPFGAGKQFGEALEGIKSFLGKLPEALDKLNNRVFKSLKEDIFPQGNGKSRVEEEIAEPVRVSLLEPLKKFLDDVTALVDSLEEDLALPIEEALAERAKIREQIEAFRRQYNI